MGWVDIDSASDLVRKCGAGGRGVTPATADGGLKVRAADQGLSKRGNAPSISHAVEETWPVMISIEHILGAANCF